MCGIAGIIHKSGQKTDLNILKKMSAALSARGPDGHGIYEYHSVGLVHTRLSIIDTELGHQPMSDTKGRTIVFNGEIYNYIEIRQQFSATYPFKTQSDTETILALYDAYGIDCVNYLRGMYAFALYDPEKNLAMVSRDPFGIKPLYYTHTADYFAFASEPKALLRSGLASHNIMTSELRAILTQNYIGGTKTPFYDISRLKPGDTYIFENGLKKKTIKRDAISPAKPRKEDEDSAIKNLESVLTNSVDVHCRSDVGYGVFLSGGVDSSTIMYILSKLQNTDKPVKSYTAYFDVPDAADERHYARAVASATGADFREVVFDEQDFKTLLPHIATYMDDPVADYAILPTWKLASVAALEQKVVLCGEGGDELFGGYGRYRRRWWKDWRKPKLSHTPSPHWSHLQREQARDIFEYLPNDLLIKLDTCLMAHGLEGRTPFLDMHVSDFAFTLPDELKLTGKNGKYILKKWLDSKLPVSAPFRKKQGFTVPVGNWMNHNAKHIAATLNHHALVKEILKQEELDNIPTLLSTPDGAKTCWPLLYLALWYSGKINQQLSGTPDIAEALSS